MYLYKFDTITKQLIWGNEYWVLSPIAQFESTVTYPSVEEGQTLQQLIDRYKERLIGKKNYTQRGDKFPLLIKFIEANQDLSIQVHPNDEYAMKHHHSFGKNEMWYILRAENETRFRIGFNRTITPDEYERRVKDSTILDVLNDVPVKPGDLIYLPAGRVHSIGGGSFLLEVQQASDVTYRIFDYNRKDKNGLQRELHTERAKEVLDYEALSDCKTPYTCEVDKEVPLLSVPYFSVSLLSLHSKQAMDYSDLDSFVLYICMKGSAVLVSENGEKVSLNEREVLLIPAEMKTVILEPEGSVEILSVSIGD